jgi:hypothetical protein
MSNGSVQVLIVMIGVAVCVLIISGAYLVYTFQRPITRWIDEWRRGEIRDE